MKLTEHASKTTGAEESLAARLAVACSQRDTVATTVPGIWDRIGGTSPSCITPLLPIRYVAVYVCLEVDVLVAITVIQA